MAYSKQMIIEAIKLERTGGELLGTLVDRYGAEMVVEALGIPHLSWSLGIKPGIEADYEDDE